MGDGLKRAVATAASLTPEMRKFLERLAPHSEPQTRGKIGCVVNREQDRARQACKRFGYAAFRRRDDGKEGWAITTAGRKALAEPPSPASSTSRVGEG